MDYLGRMAGLIVLGLMAVPVSGFADPPTSLFPRENQRQARELAQRQDAERRATSYARMIDLDDRSQRITAAVRLMEMGPEARSALPMMRAAAQAEQVPEIRALIIKAIGVVEGESSTETGPTPEEIKKRLDAQIARLTHELPLERRRAVIGIRQMGADALPGIKPLERAAEMDEDDHVRRMATSAIAYIKKEAEARRNETGDLASATSHLTMSDLIAQLRDPIPGKRIEACEILESRGFAARGALSTLQRIALTDEDAAVSQAAMKASRTILNAPNPALAEEAAVDPEVLDRQREAQRLADLPLPQLIRELTTEESSHAVMVLQAIGGRGAAAAAAIPALRAQTTHPDRNIARAADLAIQIIQSDLRRAATEELRNRPPARQEMPVMRPGDVRPE